MNSFHVMHVSNIDHPTVLSDLCTIIGILIDENSSIEDENETVYGSSDDSSTIYDDCDGEGNENEETLAERIYDFQHREERGYIIIGHYAIVDDNHVVDISDDDYDESYSDKFDMFDDPKFSRMHEHRHKHWIQHDARKKNKKHRYF